MLSHLRRRPLPTSVLLWEGAYTSGRIGVCFKLLLILTQLTNFLVVNAAHAVDPKLPAGNTTYDPETAYHHVKYDTSHADAILGMKYHDLPQTAKDIIDVFKSKRWL